MAKSAHQHAAARILTGEWLASLTYAIESRRGRSRALTGSPLIRHLTSEKLALVTAHVVTKMRRENNYPSPLTVAQEIGKLLLGAAVEDRVAEKIGAPLMGMAETCGVIYFADSDNKRAGWRAAQQVRLTPPAEAQRADIEARLAENNIAPERPLTTRPALVVDITPNYDDFDQTPPKPIGFAVAEALKPIQDTAWRVNPFMLDTLGRLKRMGWLALGKDERTAALGAIAQAKRFAKDPEFWYRCTFDWRGRLYQRGGRLQYTSGTDVARSLLEFAHGEPLTSDGRIWLGVHVATCYGVRGPFMDRMVWTDEHHAEILRAAADPITTRFWRRAKEPYRFLAACRGWADVAANPQAKVHLPVAADATASAFQHYAWLLRDEDLANKVNLKPDALSAAPKDFYADAAIDGYGRQDLKAQAWIVYGKKARTTREHGLQRVLKAQAPLAWALQVALQAEAKWRAQAGRGVDWSLPDGFRVRQANRQTTSSRTEIWLHSWGGAWSLKPRRREVLEALDVDEQEAGLPANLVHSFDACLLRAIVREGAGVSRWAVAHDSLGVHPNDGGLLRTAMVEAVECVYGSDVLASLVDAWGCPADAPLARVVRFARLGQSGDLPVSMRGGWYTFS